MKKKPLYFIRSLAALYVFSVVSFILISPSVASELFSSTVADYRAQGYEAQQKGNFDQALAYYMKAVSLGDKSAVLCNDIGVVYEELGIDDRAAYSYAQAISLDPDYLAPYANLGYFYKEKGNKDQAAKYFKERYERGGENDPRREVIRQEIFALDPTFKARFIRGELENTRQALKQKARVNFDQDVARAEGHCEQARKFIAEHDYVRAMTEFDRALAITPDNPRIVREKQRAEYGLKIEAIKAQTDSASKRLEAGDMEAARMEIHNILAIILKESAPKIE